MSEETDDRVDEEVSTDVRVTFRTDVLVDLARIANSLEELVDVLGKKAEDQAGSSRM